MHCIQESILHKLSCISDLFLCYVLDLYSKSYIWLCNSNCIIACMNLIYLFIFVNYHCCEYSLFIPTFLSVTCTMFNYDVKTRVAMDPRPLAVIFPASPIPIIWMQIERLTRTLVIDVFTEELVLTGMVLIRICSLVRRELVTRMVIPMVIRFPFP